jgi:hypothetical protein
MTGDLELSHRTREIVRKMFAAGQHEEVEQLLISGCGNNLPFCENLNAIELERIRFAALKLSGGDVSKLRQEIILAGSDWRDLLMSAGFGYSVTEHQNWAIQFLSQD